ncbi:MAG TPA: cytochrome c [Chthoniobacter sp.]|jgi:mono/diheme cytochrome c family protein
MNATTLAQNQRRLRVAIVVAVCSAALAYGATQLAANASKAPFEQEPNPSAEHGRRLFVQSCAHCHGDDARGSGEDGDGPDLFALRIGNARIAAVIRGGIPDEMPSFAKKHGATDIADLTAYLRTLR